MYEAFSVIYDDMVQGQNKIKFNRLLEFLEERNFVGKNIIELACGTGNMALMFAEKGYNILGIDISEDMIKKAILKNVYEKCRFEVMDMRNIQVNKKVDLVYCLFDGMTYIGDVNEIKKIIQNISTYLEEEGYFVFDYFSYNDYKYIYGELKCEQKYVDINDNNTIYWIEKYSNNQVETTMHIYEKLENSRFKVYQEVQHQYMYVDEDILKKVEELYDVVKVEKDDIRTTVFCKKK